ncbi:hypothetical protein D3C81_1110550 [compost metagenome]
MLNVRLTQDYAIESDKAALNFVVKERKLVDPTRAPGYKAEPGADTPPLSERWADAAYFPVTTEGLRAALDYVRFKSALSAEHTSLSGFVTELRAETERMADALERAVGGIWPEIIVRKGVA